MGGNFGKNVVIAVSLLAAGFLVAWLRFRPHLGTEGAFTDGRRTIEIERTEELRYAIWEAPRPVEGELNSDESERAPAVSPDGRYVVFVVGERGLGTDLWIADLDGRGIAIEPRPLVGVNSAADELAPSFASDGALLFASNRVGGKGGLDLWRARYDRGVFDAPQHIEGNLNTEADETDPASVPGEDAIVFASNRDHPSRERVRGLPRDHDLYTAHALPTPFGEERAWDVEPIADVNSVFEDRDPAVSADGRAILFSSDRDGGLGGFDLYRAARAPKDKKADAESEGRVWLPPQPMEGVNSASSERSPVASSDGFELLFARGEVLEEGASRAEGDLAWDVWRATSKEIVRTPGHPVGWREILVLLALLTLALLAALAKRWKGLDIIYKAFLVSLLIHLALLFWAKDVIPDAGDVELREGSETRVRVRLVEDPNSMRVQRNQERGGQVEAARNLVEATADPSRSEAAEAEAREVEARPDARTPMERTESTLAAAPQRMETREAERTAEARPVEAPLRATEEAFERLAQTAPSMQVDAARVEAARTETQSERVTRSESVAQAESAALPTAEASSAAPMERSASRSEASANAPARRTHVVDRGETVAALTSDERTPTISGPAAEFDRKTADARQATNPLEVSASGAASMEQRAEGEQSALSAEAPRVAVSTPDGASDPSLQPSRQADLARSSSGSALASAPRRTAVETDRATPGPASESARTVRVSDDLGDSEVVRSEAVTSPQFNALTGAGSDQTAMERTDSRPTGVATAEPTIGEVAVAELTPSAVSPLARSRDRSSAPAPPSLAPRSAPSLQRSETGDARRDVDVQGPAAEEVRVASAADAPERESGADLAPTDLSTPLSRSRAERNGSGPAAGPSPGRLADAAPKAEIATSAPAPMEFAIDAPEAPAVTATMPVPERGSDQWERTPYQSRSGERKVAALEEFGGNAETERAVESGLTYLAKRQRTDGRWGRKEVDEKYGQPMIGKTGLATLAFMGAGHTHVGDSMYAGNVQNGLDFLMRSQDPRSGHFGNTSSYGHAIATYALGEAYALTGDDAFRAPLERAVQQIVDHQVASRDPLLDGGWSYFYGNDRTFDRWPRASVTVWQVMALESAKLGGIKVPAQVFRRARSFLVRTWDPSRGAFRYSHDPSRLRSDYPLLPGSTPATMFALSLLGADLGEDQFAPARRFVLERSPDGYRFTGDDDFVYRAQGNLYFWYYGTLAMFRSGGDDWRRWNTAMKDTLIPAQEENGSWRPISIYAGYAQDTDGDRCYTTAMNVLALEVYYRYFTPLLSVDGVGTEPR